MPILLLETTITASKEIVFDLSRSIDLHKISAKHTNENAIAGKTSGLIGLNETVTWRAKHMGFYQNLTSRITEFDRPNYFVDEMVKGAFDRFRHEHHFSQNNGVTMMKDIFDYKSPLGLLGSIADTILLKTYLTKLLSKRNSVIKEFAESEKWRDVLAS